MNGNEKCCAGSGDATKLTREALKQVRKELRPVLMEVYEAGYAAGEKGEKPADGDVIVVENIIDDVIDILSDAFDKIKGVIEDKWDEVKKKMKDLFDRKPW
jgi:hypothetical protein